MVRIRLARRGCKKSPFFQIVAAEQKSPRDGCFLKILGSYNPSARGQEKSIILDLNAVDLWISQGAQCSDTVRDLIKKYRYQIKQETAVA
jgi:small subunit ribosomal protein S16